MVVAMTAFLLVAAACSDDDTGGLDLDATDLIDLDDALGTEEFQGRGDDPNRDVLWDECADGNFGSCDVLYYISPFGSEYEEFGDTCGGRIETSRLCLVEFGESPDLDALRLACAGGGFIECDLLYSISDIDSEYERFGDTCGDRGRTATWCVDEYGARHP
jgi:hypothetical protein